MLPHYLINQNALLLENYMPIALISKLISIPLVSQYQMTFSATFTGFW